MPLINRMDWRAGLELAMRKSPRPIYVINLLQFRNFNAYRWYGLLVFPVIRAVGGAPVWIGEHRQSLVGEPVREHLLLVRYPSHRRFLAMVMNPYYEAINLFREAGVDSFEAAFSQRKTGSDLLGELDARDLVCVHGGPDRKTLMDRAGRALKGIGAEHLLTVEEYAALPTMTPPKPSDPLPHTYKRNAFYRIDEPQRLEEIRESLAEFEGKLSVQHYHASRRRDYLPQVPLLDSA